MIHNELMLANIQCKNNDVTKCVACNYISNTLRLVFMYITVRHRVFQERIQVLNHSAQRPTLADVRN